MTEPNYITKISVPDRAYYQVSTFLVDNSVKMESDWGLYGLNYGGKILYLDNNNEKIAKISRKRLFRRRQIELSDKVDKDTINMIKQIIKFS